MSVEYKVIHSENGIKGLETAVSKYLSDGWKPIGGIAFNQGYPYQAIAKVKKEQKKAVKKEENTRIIKPKNIASDEYY